MKRKRFLVEQIVALGKEARGEAPVTEFICKVEISEQMFCLWKKVYRGLEPSQARKLKQPWFVSMQYAKRDIEAWRVDYNESEPQVALGDRAPLEYAVRSAHVPVTPTSERRKLPIGLGQSQGDSRSQAKQVQ